jgi:hypothetical protein
VPESRLTDSQMFHLAWAVRDGTADPEGALKMFREFMDSVDNDEAISTTLIRYVADAFRFHLNEGCPLESAFGVTRRKYGRKSTQEQHRAYAVDVLNKVLAGKLFQLH